MGPRSDLLPPFLCVNDVLSMFDVIGCPSSSLSHLSFFCSKYLLDTIV